MKVLRRSRKPLAAFFTFTALVCTLAGTLAGTAPAQASVATITKTSTDTHHTYLRSANGWQYVAAEHGWNGTTTHSVNTLRARTTIPGPWEGFTIVRVPTASTQSVALLSDASGTYVTAEFSWSGAAFGALHARPTQKTIGPWETFWLHDIGNGTFTLQACANSTSCYFVSADHGSGYPGDLQGVLQANKKAAAADEMFAEGPGPLNLISGNDDYPWKNLPVDTPIGGFQNARECDSFVAWRIYENSGGRQYVHGNPGPSGGGTPTDYQTYSVDVNTIGPNAADWANNAPGYNDTYWVDNIPTAGSVAQWNANSGGMKEHGHVAYVSKVYSDGGIDIENYNLILDGKYALVQHIAKNSGFSYRGYQFSWPDNFVHINQYH